jgi:methyltransferase (TIGR00027 family)
MSKHKVSRTALRTAYLRAAHQLLDAQPLILDDPIVVPLIGADGVQLIHETAEHYYTPERRALRAHVVLRSRFAEDRLEAAVRRDIRQYVILGAGFDTFSLRQPEWAQILEIYEFDQPGTQALKRSLISSAELSIPANVDFVAIDFEKESLSDAFLRTDVSMEEPTFFSWLGVMMYLKEETINTVIRSVASFPAGSEIVLTYQPPPGESPLPLEQRVAVLDEPWVTYFEPDDLEAKLRDAGFTIVEFLTPAEAKAMYFRQRLDNLTVSRRTNILCARL